MGRDHYAGLSTLSDIIPSFCPVGIMSYNVIFIYFVIWVFFFL